MCNKVSKCIGILYRLKHFPRNILLMIYNAIISPHLNYCNIVWANFRNYSMMRLFLLQKKAVRIVFHANYLAHSKPIFTELKLLNIFDMNDFNIAVFMFLVFNKIIPSSLSKIFKFNTDFYLYNMRKPLDFHLPFERTNVGINSIFFKGPKIWNEIPDEIKLSVSLNTFKRLYKKNLLRIIHVIL